MVAKEENPVWRKFEEAVTTFLQALDPQAKITHDVSIPDRDTGKPRQRDVWIESFIAGFKVNIYVSCKDYKRKINQQDMDAVIGELASSSANKGVIFAKNGFGDDAKKKAKAHNIDCCILLGEDESVEIPKELNLNFFTRRGRVSFNFGIPDRSTQMAFIGSKALGQKSRVVVVLAKELNRIVRQSCANDFIPTHSVIAVESSVNNMKVTVKLHHQWEYYVAKLSNKLFKGSYNFSQQEFRGTVTSPAIDTTDPDLGDQWTKLDKAPDNPAGIIIQIEPNYNEFWKGLTKEAGWMHAQQADDSIFEQGQ